MSTMTISPTYALRPGEVRLTRRGRLAVFLVALAFVLALGVLLGSRSIATDQAGPGEATRVVMVDEGQTLWQIAAGLSEDGEVRSMMHRIEQLNALETSMLYAGQELHVPVAE